jgi:hypothetical protein
MYNSLLYPPSVQGYKKLNKENTSANDYEMGVLKMWVRVIDFVSVSTIFLPYFYDISMIFWNSSNIVVFFVVVHFTPSIHI